jgi:hypothetical protein
MKGTSSPKPNTATAVHIPFLDSKLTYLLKESFGGNCRTTFIATISETDEYEITTKTLNFVANAKEIQNSLKPNSISLSDEELQEFQFESYFLR